MLGAHFSSLKRGISFEEYSGEYHLSQSHDHNTRAPSPTQVALCIRIHRFNQGWWSNLWMWNHGYRGPTMLGFLYKGLQHLRILVSGGWGGGEGLEPIPRRY